MKRLEQEAKEWEMIHQEVKQDRSGAGKIKGLILTKNTARFVDWIYSKSQNTRVYKEQKVPRIASTKSSTTILG